MRMQARTFFFFASETEKRLSMTGTFRHRRIVLEKASFTSRAEAAENWAVHMTDGQLAGCPLKAVPPPERLLRLVWVAFLPLHFTCRVFSSITSRGLVPAPANSHSLRAHGYGGRVCSLRSGVRRAFPTLSRLRDCTGKPGAARPWKCQCGLEIEARLPGSSPLCLLYPLGAEKWVTRNSPEFYFFICLQKTECSGPSSNYVSLKKITVASCEFSFF